MKNNRYKLIMYMNKYYNNFNNLQIKNKNMNFKNN